MNGFAQASMLALFRGEAEVQTQAMTSALLALERDARAVDQLDACMRSAHSLKGAARIIGLEVGVLVAHAMEDCFVAAQQSRITLRNADIDSLLGATDLLLRIASTPEAEIGSWSDGQKPDVDSCLAAMARILAADDPSTEESSVDPLATPVLRRATDLPAEASDRVLRVTAENLNRLLGLASETLVGSRWIRPFAESMLRLKRLQQESGRRLDGLQSALPAEARDERVEAALADARRTALEVERLLGEQLAELDLFDRRSGDLSNRLYDEALTCRMRPFSDGVEAWPRLVRDVARRLGKQVRLEIIGETTQVDRDILRKLDAPLGHLLRNAVDHGIESPEERLAAGKPAEGVLRLEVRHGSGALQITLADDGRGIHPESLRRTVVERKLINQEAAAALSDTELLEFLFLPGFSMKGSVTDISGRGVGLDVVQDMVKQVRGTVRASTQPGKGTRFHLQLPVTLSMVRTLLVEVGGEPYAFLLGQVLRTVRVPKASTELLEGRQHIDFDGKRIGLVVATQVLEAGEAVHPGDDIAVVVIGDSSRVYGLVVDRFLGERELVVQPLDPLLGKVKDISAGALMPDGSPVLIVDAEDLLRSMDRLVADGGLNRVRHVAEDTDARKRKRVLVVDDSLTVREVERKLLSVRGYDVEVAVDGMDGWNAVRAGHFDLVVTDIDMPRMDGIELVTLINKDPNLQAIPVMVVSYKDRDEDRRRGLEAGAAHYLTKGSFHDESLLQAVVDLIGEADA